MIKRRFKGIKKVIKTNKALRNMGVEIGKVDVKGDSHLITLRELSYAIVDESRNHIGVMGLCDFRGRKVYQVIPLFKMKRLGILPNNQMKKVVVGKRKGGQGGKGISMTLISYVALENLNRGNKLLREYNYKRNQRLVDFLKVTYQNSAIPLYWVCENCGTEFKYLLNNRVGHSVGDCPKCCRGFYVTSTAEELIALVLQKSLPSLNKQVPLFKDGRKRVDMLYPDKHLIIEYDGVFHNAIKDYERDLEAKSLGYTTIRITEITPYPCLEDIDFIHEDKAPYNPVIDRYTIFSNYFKYGDDLTTLTNVLIHLQEVLEMLGVDIDICEVTDDMLKMAERRRIINKSKN